MKKSLIIALVLLVLVVAAGAVYLLFFQNKNKPEEINISSSLDFDDLADQGWLDLLPMDETQANLTSNPDYLFEGSLRMAAGSDLRGANAKTGIYAGSILHIRMRAGADGPCFQVSIFTPLSPAGEKNLRMGGCPYSALDVAVMINQPEETQSAIAPFTGIVIVPPGEWFDVIFWYNMEGDRVYYFAGNDTDPNQLLYGAVSLPEDWQPTSWVVGFGGFFGGQEMTPEAYVDVDFIRYAYGQVTDYLYYNLPGYLANQESVDIFMLEKPVSLDTLDFEQH